MVVRGSPPASHTMRTPRAIWHVRDTVAGDVIGARGDGGVDLPLNPRFVALAVTLKVFHRRVLLLATNVPGPVFLRIVAITHIQISSITEWTYGPWTLLRAGGLA